MLNDLLNIAPSDIEARSMEIIASELKPNSFNDDQLPIVKRVIHTSADFDYADNLRFTPNAVSDAVAALANGCSIFTDTQMARAGINKRVLSKLGGDTFCFIADPDVAETAKQKSVTRASVAVDYAAALNQPLIFAIGNAPTALVRLCQLIANNAVSTPILVIGVPVGFVNVVESKNILVNSPVQSITALGRKGGSNVAAAICNALIYAAANDIRD